MRKRHDPRCYLDISAKEDGDDEDDDDEDEEEFIESSEEDLDGADLDIPSAQHLFSTADEEADLDAIVTAVLHRASERGYDRPLPDPSVEQSSASRILSLPRPRDVLMFSIQVKKGKELTLTLRLMKKAQHLKLTDIVSIFCVPKAPGRLYVEAQPTGQLRRLCEGIVFIYTSSIFIVPVTERVALLEDGGMTPVVNVGQKVRVRTGTYKGDVGEVVKVDVNDAFLTVKLKTREALRTKYEWSEQTESRHHLVDSTNSKQQPSFPSVNAAGAHEDHSTLDVQNGGPVSRKRKRRDFGRREPYLLDREALQHSLRAHPGDADCSSFRDLGEDGFLVEKRHYSFDGYLLLRIRYDRVERHQEGIPLRHSSHHEESRKCADEHMRRILQSFQKSNPSFTSAASDNDAMGSSSLDPQFIHVGDSVRITGGQSAGCSGRVVELVDNSQSALVDLGFLEPTLQRSTVIEADLCGLERVFQVGERIEVKVGHLKGKTGIIFLVEDRKVHVVNPQELSEFEVFTAFIDSHTLPGATLIPIPSCELKLGSHVKILRGKHSGKTGKVGVIERKYIRVIDDFTDVELIIRKDNVELLFGETIEDSHLDGDTTSNERDPGNGARCDIDHAKEGFERQTVYVWRGLFKGKLGIVLRVSGGLARLGVESAIHGNSILNIPTNSLVAKCTCVLASKVSLPWSEKELDNIAELFNRKLPLDLNRREDNEASTESANPTFHDPEGDGMWIFDQKLSEVRKEYHLVVKILSHKDPRISGNRTGRVLSCENPLSHPIPIETPPNVLVKFMDTNSNERVESLPVHTLRRTPLLKNKGTHVIIGGEHSGTVVRHRKSCGEQASVIPVESKSFRGLSIDKKYLCVIEKSNA